MKAVVFGAGLMALLQSGGSPVLMPTDHLDPSVLPTPCVPTEPMPIARLDSTEVARYRMPVIEPDTTRIVRMPFAPLVPCYQQGAPATLLPQIAP